MSHDVVLVDAPDGPVTTVTVNRPQALNALDGAAVGSLLEVFDRLAGTRAVRCVILTGAGDKAFAAGADIKAMSNMTPEAAEAFSELAHRLGERLEGLHAPVIAAVNGFAMGGGCELALACDFIYAVRTAKFGLPEVSLGVIPGMGGTQRLPHRVGLAQARELLFTGRVIDAEEAKLIGMVNQVVEPGELMARARATAELIASRAPHAVSAAKRAANASANQPLSRGLELESSLFSPLFGTVDQKEGMRAFLDKRSPKWTGD